MSNINPIDNLRQVPAFLRGLREDLHLLLAPDLPSAVIVPDRSRFADEAHYSSATREVRRHQMFATIQQAVQKQQIREGLWPKFLACWFLAAPVTFPLAILLPVIWVSCAWSNPAIFRQFDRFAPACTLIFILWVGFAIIGHLWRKFVPAGAPIPVPAMRPGRNPLTSTLGRDPQTTSWNASPAGSSRNPLFGILAQSPLLRDRGGRLIIPDLSLLSAASYATKFSDNDLRMLHAEVLGRRRAWRIKHYAKMLFFLGVLLVTFIAMPLAVSHQWPFN